MLLRNVYCAIALLLFSASVVALEIGFESQVLFTSSDNINGTTNSADAAFTDNDPNNGGERIEDGQLGNIQFGVFGEQNGTRLKGGFAGEIYSRGRLDDSDSNFSSVTQFIGAAELQITPRSFSWYVGDILGSVRTDDGLQSIDLADDDRRNVFVTGPQFVYELGSFSRVNANFLYVNQTQDDVELESLFNTNADWSFDTDRGNTWGATLNNIFTDSPSSAATGDLNRFSLAGIWSRDRGRNTYNARLGGTRYDTEDQSLNGVVAQFSLERQLSAQTFFGVSLSRDLRDQSLDLVQSIIDDGAGSDDGDGLFDETRFDLTYGLTSAETTLDFYAGVGHSEFRLVSDDDTGFVASQASLQDRTTYSAGSSFSRDLNARARVNAAVDYSQQDFTNTAEGTQSLLGEAQFVYRLTRSFEAQLGYRMNLSDGQRTGSDNVLRSVDSTENRLLVGLRWAPPTRATKDLTIQLKSLVQ